jgi:hypothetical protein
MLTATEVLVLVVGVSALVLLGGIFTRAWWSSCGTRLVTCPETREPAAVRINPWKAGTTAVSGSPVLRLHDCSRWPERAGCGQACLEQIVTAPDGCLVKTLVHRWYANQRCAVCRKALGDLGRLDHQPALLAADGVTREWRSLAPEQLPAAMDGSRPICWDCHVAVTFRRHHHDLVIDDPRPAPGSRSVG